MSEQENIHQGHRRKVRESFYASGLNGMADHNILEFLLFFGIPYKDTNPIAHELINKFGSLSGVFRADMNDLLSVKGMTENAACLINLILPLYRRFSEDLLSKKPVLLTNEEVVEFIKPQFFGSAVEKLFVLCFDSNHSLISATQLAEGDVTKANFDLRKLASVVLETKAQSVILVHNHPNGISLPSQSDVEATKEAFSLLQALNVNLSNHLIISDSGYCSMIDIPKFVHLFYGADPLFE